MRWCVRLLASLGGAVLVLGGLASPASARSFSVDPSDVVATAGTVEQVADFLSSVGTGNGLGRPLDNWSFAWGSAGGIHVDCRPPGQENSWVADGKWHCRLRHPDGSGGMYNDWNLDAPLSGSPLGVFNYRCSWDDTVTLSSALVGDGEFNVCGGNMPATADFTGYSDATHGVTWWKLDTLADFKTSLWCYPDAVHLPVSGPVAGALLVESSLAPTPGYPHCADGYWPASVQVSRYPHGSSQGSVLVAGSVVDDSGMHGGTTPTPTPSSSSSSWPTMTPLPTPTATATPTVPATPPKPDPGGCADLGCLTDRTVDAIYETVNSATQAVYNLVVCDESCQRFDALQMPAEAWRVKVQPWTDQLAWLSTGLDGFGPGCSCEGFTWTLDFPGLEPHEYEILNTCSGWGATLSATSRAGTSLLLVLGTLGACLRLIGSAFSFTYLYQQVNGGSSQGGE